MRWATLSSPLSEGVVISVGLGAILELWGINVAGLVAGLGIGGLAFALAAKDTAANLFGSIALLLDKSIRIGEWIRIDGVEGIVEDIGMRTQNPVLSKSSLPFPSSVAKPFGTFLAGGFRAPNGLGVTYVTTRDRFPQISQVFKGGPNLVFSRVPRCLFPLGGPQFGGLGDRVEALGQGGPEM